MQFNVENNNLPMLDVGLVVISVGAATLKKKIRQESTAFGRML